MDENRTLPVGGETDVLAVLNECSSRPWSKAEHHRFQEGLEKYGNGTAGNEWQELASHVGTRHYNDVKLHAHKYFLRLQTLGGSVYHDSGTTGAQQQPLGLSPPAARTVHCHGAAAAQPLGSQWNLSDELSFEQLLASSYALPEPRRSEAIVALMPDKTVEDVRARVAKLRRDVSFLQIAAMPVSLVYVGRNGRSRRRRIFTPTDRQGSIADDQSALRCLMRRQVQSLVV